MGFWTGFFTAKFLSNLKIEFYKPKEKEEEITCYDFKYILDKKKKVIPIKTFNENGIIEKNLLKWAKWFENIDNRIVSQDNIGKYFISTVFLGIDHNFMLKGKPILWETGIKTEKDGWDIVKRYSSHKQALKGHNELLKKYKKLITKNKK